MSMCCLRPLAVGIVHWCGCSAVVGTMSVSHMQLAYTEESAVSIGGCTWLWAGKFIITELVARCNFGLMVGALTTCMNGGRRCRVELRISIKFDDS